MLTLCISNEYDTFYCGIMHGDKMENFTPVSAIIGGSLIGISSVLLLWFDGRIAGISGIMHGLYPPKSNEFLWRIVFIIGLILGSFIYYGVPEIQFIPRSHYPIPVLLGAGFLVGIGTKLSSGCTSGHGVCGIARMSPRSWVATGLFFISALITTYLIRHYWAIL